ncbi:Isochorismatase hydrolase [Polyplosphaeria fusca]|uniref:Isochorismatase hydrolase n=1 Tax=Polyplosphaeria fusca TaxID=682080 RepID=A0A9P4UZ54_9PLEO|nr:Isochorismatase hydrolase [Polyplosphaeria fusca]
MPNVLVLSFEGFSFSSRQLFPQLLPKLLSRAAVHESLTIRDALHYVHSGWPSIILITDAVITLELDESQHLLDTVADYTKHGCTTVWMGFTAETVSHSRLSTIFKENFDLRWRVGDEEKLDTTLAPVEETMLRRTSLVPSFYANALFLSKVPTAQTVYAGSSPTSVIAYAAFARVGLGKLGYIGDMNFGEEAERLILAMCHMDRPEDALQDDDPSKSALIIIDMQNFFLSPAFGRSEGAGHLAARNLQSHVIPAARKAGIKVLWVNWGLTQKEVEEMPPAVSRAFGFWAVDGEELEGVGFGDGGERSFGVDKFGEKRFQGGHALLENGLGGAVYKGLGSECGTVEVGGKIVEAGKLLMRDTWNAALYSPLGELYEEGTKLEKNPDVWIHKNRMSAMWGTKPLLEEFLESEGIRTLFFTGVNTDQCVGGTFTDCFSKGYDCVLLSDGCGTTSPDFAQQCFEFNAAKTFGFCLSCEDFARGIDGVAD